MAKIDRENIGVLNDRISITVGQEDYNPGFQKVLKQYSKDASMPGFRKGKVPTSLIKKMYGKELFPQEVLKSVENGLNDYLKDQKLSLFGQPILNPDESAPKVDMNNPQEYTFDFEVGIRPEVNMEDIKKELSFTKYKIKPSKEQIDEELERIQLRAATFEDQEEIEGGDKDVVEVTFEASDKKGTPLEDEEKKEDKYRFSYFSPKMQKQLKGKKKGDTIIAPLKDFFAEKELDWVIEDWKEEKETAPEKYFLLTVNNYQKTVPHELNEELYEEVYPGSEIKTKEDFVKKVTEDYQGLLEHDARHLMEHDIFEKLVGKVKMDLPVDFLKKQLKNEGKEEKTEEQVEEEFSEFEKQTRWGVITSAIINSENLEVTPEEIKANLQKQVLGYFGMTEAPAEQNEMIDDLTNRLLQDENRINDTYRTLITGKMFDWLTENSTIEDKEVSSAQFEKIMEEHNHEHHGHQ